jgi:outer membrane receptor protein involved in Fe transport
MGVWASNLANKKYLIDGGNTGEDFGVPTYIPGTPRTFGISISGKF